MFFFFLQPLDVTLHESSDGGGGIGAEIGDGLAEKRPAHGSGRKIKMEGISVPSEQNEEEEES